jgi:hypothetical protein
MIICLLLIFFCSQGAYAQIADASFFPNVKSYNPGIVHKRKSGFISVDVSQNNVEKFHDIQTGGLTDGIRTNVEMTKTTLFRAGKGGGPTVELLYDTETGYKEETIKSPSLGTRKVKTDATSGYYGGTLDLGFIGVQIGRANYDYFYNFRVGSVPNISAADMDWQYDFDVLKIGTTFNLFGFSLGGFIFTQNMDISLDYTFYDPATGNQGSTLNNKFEGTTKGYGVGLGHSSSFHHIELSLEQVTDQEFKQPDPLDLLTDVNEPDKSSRITFIIELKYKSFAVGATISKIKGNFTDLENIMAAKLIYEEMTLQNERLENTFNFSLGDQKGITYSAFYSTSEVDTDEESYIFDNGYEYPANTKTQAYGLNLSYIY